MNDSASNDADEFFALQFALENAKETISEILVSLNSDPGYSINKLRQQIKNTLTDFADICLAQDKIISSVKNSPKAGFNPRHGQAINLDKLPFLIPNPLRQTLSSVGVPNSARKIRKKNIIPNNKRTRKQNLFDEDKLVLLDDSDRSEIESKEEEEEEEDSNSFIDDEKTADIKGDLQATSDFLDEYRKKTDIEFNENCPEKFTMNQLENLGSANYKRTNLEVVEECEMCVQEYIENEKVSFLTCHHKFHTACIKKWLTHRNECPVCGLKACLDFTI